MGSELSRFIDETTEAVRPLEKGYNLAEWESAVNGTPQALERTQQAQAAYMRFWSDSERCETARRYDQERSPDPLLARQIKLIYLTAAQNQQDEETIDRLTSLESEVRGLYTNFRGKVDGRELSDNEMDDVLARSSDAQEVRRVWEASKQVGEQVAGQIRELARVRNRAAQRQGFRDYFQRSLVLSEIDETQLLTLFDSLAAQTEAPFDRLMDSIRQQRSRHFGLSPAELEPCHFGDRFFQQVPPMGEVDYDSLFADKDPVALATETYDGLGMDVRDVLARSDLHARPGKNQHAFMTDIDREGDIRTLNNVQPNHRWNETLHHELGHAVYEKYIDKGLPWLLRYPPHLLSTEAIAIMMGRVTLNEEWLKLVLKVPASKAAAVAAAAADRRRASGLIFTRWCLVMTNFERRLYGDPEADLDTIWWDLVRRYQSLRLPAGRRAPDWAAKYHVALAPVYYQNYELGHLVSAQLMDRVTRHAGGFVARKAAGEWLQERFFRPGARQDWSAHVASATGEALNPRYFVDGLN